MQTSIHSTSIRFLLCVVSKHHWNHFKCQKNTHNFQDVQTCRGGVMSSKPLRGGHSSHLRPLSPTILRPRRLSFLRRDCWWFRHPAIQPVEVGGLPVYPWFTRKVYPHYLQGVLHPGGDRRIFTSTSITSISYNWLGVSTNGIVYKNNYGMAWDMLSLWMAFSIS